MSIWKTQITPEAVIQSSKNTLIEHLNITITEIGDDYIHGTMPVDHRTHQPAGILHGGASVVLAESLASIAGSHCIDPKRFFCVGLEINCNHIRQVKQGFVTGTARPVHIGRMTQVWEIRITDEREKLVAISRITLANIEKREEK